jgi:hypothetical protein
MAIKIIYDPVHGKPIPDGLLQSEVESIISGTTGEFTVSSELFIDAIRVCIVNGQISNQDIVFVYKGEEMKPDENGRLRNWPPGFCDTHQKLLRGLITNTKNKS